MLTSILYHRAECSHPKVIVKDLVQISLKEHLLAAQFGQNKTWGWIFLEDVILEKFQRIENNHRAMSRLSVDASQMYLPGA